MKKKTGNPVFPRIPVPYPVSFILLIFLVLHPLSFILAYDLPSSTGVSHLFFEADSAEYDRSLDRLNLKGNARVTEKEREGGLPGRVMKGEEFHVWPASSMVVSPGKVLVEEDVNAIYGDSGEFNTATRRGRLNGVAAAYSPWLIQGKSLDLREGKHIYKRAVMTSCDEIEPHFRIKASRLSAIPDKRILAYNAFFYLDKMPVLYLPFFYKSLGKDPAYVTILEPGHDEKNGEYLKSTTMHRFSPSVTGKLFLDYFGRRGIGTGFEADYDDRKSSKANFSVYRIREYGSSQDRWSMAGGHWIKMAGEISCPTCPAPVQYYSQSQFRLISDTHFNNDFFRANPFAVSPDMNASMAFVRQTPLTISRLSWYRLDIQKPGSNHFQKSFESRPRLDFQTSPMVFKGIPLMHTFSSYFNSVQNGPEDVFHKSAGATWSAT
ncbi:MAG: hypothetical protein ABIG11_01140, partial [bacterium]